jgi:hypothetical protein
MIRTVTGLTIGLFVALTTFGILFTHATKDLFPVAFVPLGVAALFSFGLAWMEPRRWLWLAFCVALPTIIMSTLILSQLWLENRNDWSWFAVMAVAVGVWSFKLAGYCDQENLMFFSSIVFIIGSF